MTIYIVISCVVGVIAIYLYGRREGEKDSELDMLSESNERLNELRSVKENIKKEVNQKLDTHSNNPVGYWVSNNGAKKSGDVSSSDETRSDDQVA